MARVKVMTGEKVMEVTRKTVTTVLKCGDEEIYEIKKGLWHVDGAEVSEAIVLFAVGMLMRQKKRVPVPWHGYRDEIRSAMRKMKEQK